MGSLLLALEFYCEHLALRLLNFFEALLALKPILDKLLEVSS